MMDLAKKKRRLVYLGIIFICFSFLALSISGLFRFTTYVKKEEKPILKEIIDEDSKRKQKLTQVPGTNDVTQEIYGLYLPTYDDNGKVVSVIRGAYTIFLDNKTYKITKPEIEFADDSNNDGNDYQPKGVVITSDFGEVEKTTNRGYLYGNVITRLGEDLEIYTEDFTYSPEGNTVNTDGPVTVKGKQMKITGTGFEISLSDANASIKNDPEMEIRSEDDLFLFSDQASPSDRGTAVSIFIRASGEMVFENKKRLATFYDNVRISKGKSTIFADKLEVPFDSKMESLQKVIASGNVLASDGEKNAKGEKLTWDSEKEIAILEDDPVAEFFDSRVSITASTIKFSKTQGRMEVPVSGQLTTVANMQSSKHDKNDVNKKTKSIFVSSDKNTTYENITINWKGKMSFEQNTNQALFEDNVVVNKGGTKLYCERLLISLDNEDDTLKQMVATKDIHLIQRIGDSLREARGNKLVWTSTRNYIELFGSPLASVSDGDKQISAPKITFSEDENKILAEGKGNLLAKTSSEKDGKDAEHLNINWNKEMIYNGSNQVANFYEMIKVTKGKEKLDCDRLDVFFDNKDKIKKITAFGNVYIASPDSDNTEGLGSLLVWDLTEDLAVLTGNPLAELRRSGARTFSEKIYFDIRSKRVHWEGRPHWKIFGALK